MITILFTGHWRSRQRERVVIDHDPFTGHWRSRQRERVVIDHDPFTSRARPGGVFGSAFPWALPLRFLCARTRCACKTAPRWAKGEASAFPLVAGPGGAKVGRALRASRIRGGGPPCPHQSRGGGPQRPQICGGNLPPPRFAGTEARHPEKTCARPRLPAIGLSLAEPLECAKQFCRRAMCAPQVKAIASLMVKRFQKRSRSQVRTVKNLRVSLPFHKPLAKPPTRKVGD